MHSIRSLVTPKGWDLGTCMMLATGGFLFCFSRIFFCFLFCHCCVCYLLLFCVIEGLDIFDHTSFSRLLYTDTLKLT